MKSFRLFDGAACSAKQPERLVLKVAKTSSFGPKALLFLLHQVEPPHIPLAKPRRAPATNGHCGVLGAQVAMERRVADVQTKDSRALLGVSVV